MIWRRSTDPHLDPQGCRDDANTRVRKLGMLSCSHSFKARWLEEKCDEFPEDFFPKFCPPGLWSQGSPAPWTLARVSARPL